ncbi:hypothetical protein JTE90_014183 [Oedothorax gibbosus]|uniref:CCHC-type domain-containing protein n=1 Tax=Oedothorax gibbosus TaxID=931172 RepID=A0AAV6VKE5_9ARAC|nr:hypothetical protein JTE90_014183 [Oedothorax gibbosus]
MKAKKNVKPTRRQTSQVSERTVVVGPCFRCRKMGHLMKDCFDKTNKQRKTPKRPDQHLGEQSSRNAGMFYIGIEEGDYTQVNHSEHIQVKVPDYVRDHFFHNFHRSIALPC